MAIFSRGIPRWTVLLLALAMFCLIPPETWARGPNLCLWRRVFHLSVCPACGSTRALAALFHGQFARAFAFNRNVALTAPGLLTLLGLDTLHGVRQSRRWQSSRNCPAPRQDSH